MKLNKHMVEQIAKQARSGRTPEEIAQGLTLALCDVLRIFDRDNLHPKVFEVNPLAKKTNEMYAEHALENLKLQAESDLRYSRDELAKFASSFGTDSAHAFEWSNSAFQHAARERIALTVLSYFEHLETKPEPESLAAYRGPKAKLAIIAGEFYRETVSKAKWPEHSTSPTSNHMSICINARRAEVMEGVMARLATCAPELLSEVIR